MRSSVTVILSNPPADTTMSYPDYNQSVEDHQCLLVLVKQIGNQLKPKTFNYLYERLSRQQYVRVRDSQGSVNRGIWVCYKRNYPVENNEWGDFQAHRKVLGLISIGKCTNQSELEGLCRAHEATREKYKSTILNSRCLVFGYVHQDLDPASSSSFGEKENVYNLLSPIDHTTDDDDNDDDEDTKCSGDSRENVLDNDSGVFSSPPQLDSHDSDVDGGYLSKREAFQNGLNSAVQNVMINPASGEPIRPEKGDLKRRGHFRNMSLPTSPIRAFVSSGSSIGGNPITSENLNLSLPPSPTCMRRQISSSGSSASSSNSSSRQNLMTLSSVKSELLCYPNVESCNNLENDLQDFFSSLFWVLESKRLDKSHEKLDRVPFLFAPCEKKDFVGLNLENRVNKKRSQGRMKKHIGDLSFLAGLPSEALNYYTAAADILKSVNDWLWLASCYEGLCAASVVTMYPRQHRKSFSLHRNLSFPAGNSPYKSRAGSFSSHSLPNGVDPAEFKCKNCLSPDEIINKYREAIVNYSKYHNATVIEMEANIKATKILILQEKYLLASEFIQNLVFVKGQQIDEEKVQRYLCLSQLYTQIGFHRKAALFRRTAALKCISGTTTDPNWSQCYHLLLQALEGYQLSLDSKQYNKAKGWPVLQIHMLKELTTISRRMENAVLAVRHITFLLHNLFDYLTVFERRELCNQLSVLTSKCEAAPVPLVLENGIILPAVNLTNLPCVKLFKPENLAPHLRPMRLRPEMKSPAGPFIFSPLQFGQNKKDPNSNKTDFKWVEGDACDVALHIFNPLACELKVSNMVLLADGISFETFPACLDLPGMSGPYPVNLIGTPRNTGTLEILGYSTHVFGVKSTCRLSELPSIKKPSFVIEVVPALPQIQVVTSLPKAVTFSSFGDTSCIVTSVTLSLYAGARQECNITLVNFGRELVEMVEVEVESKLEKDLEERFCTLNLKQLEEQLPLAPSKSATFSFCIHAIGDLVSPSKSHAEESVFASNPSSETTSTLTVPSKSSRTLSSGSISSAIRSSTAYSSFRRKFSDIAPPSPSPSSSAQSVPLKVIELMLKVRYSGGSGLRAGYCRQSAIAVEVEMTPSIMITKWDVLPAEKPTHCYLVLDILNSTEHEMEVQYTEQKKILIEAQETCRIPVPVERCPMSKLTGASKEEAVTICSKHLENLVKLEWTIGATEASGVASLSHLVWTRAMLDLIHMSPIQWEISLNDEVFNSECDLNFVLGEVINLTIAITNYSDSALANLNLTVDCYQDYQNGQSNFRLENKLAFIGCDYFNIPLIKLRETYTHVCGIMFFACGVFKLDVQCSSLALPRRRSIAHETPVESTTKDGHTWKCMRTIEITVAQKGT